MNETQGPRWRKSSHSNSGNCAEVRAGEGAVRVRDSQDPDGPELDLDEQAWRDFLARLRTQDSGRICGLIPQ